MASNTVWFEITLENGEKHTGPVQGNGGLIGAGYSDHLPVDEREARALKRLEAQIERANNGESLWIYDMGEGVCLLFPHYSADSNGPELPIPLKGATARVSRR